MILECVRDNYLYTPTYNIGLTKGKCYEVISMRCNGVDRSGGNKNLGYCQVEGII